MTRAGSPQVATVPPGAEAMLDAAPLAILAVDGHDRITAMNAAAETLLGRSRALLAGAPLSEALNVCPDLSALLASARSAGTATGDLDLTTGRGEGTMRAANVAAARIAPDAATGPASGDDVHAALVLLIRTDPLRKLYRPGTGAQRPAGLAALIAHEVRNPLAGLKGAAQFLLRDAARDHRELLGIIVAESDRIARLIDRLDNIGSMDPGAKTTLNIHAVLRRAREMALAGFASGLGIAEDYDPSLPPIAGHEDLLVQAVLNLLRNGAEAMSQAGGGALAGPLVGTGDAGPGQPRRQEALTITTKARSGVSFVGTARAGRGGVEISVTDRGCGIPDDVRASLFLPFVTTRSRGTGLGLSVVAEAAAAHGGLVEYESRPGLTVFRLVLPLGVPAGAEARSVVQEGLAP